MLSSALVAALLATAHAAPSDGRDFAEEARLLYRMVACAGDAPLPAHVPPAKIEAHCKKLAPSIAAYRKKYVDGARRFIAERLPPGLPARVVYPFGGGDLLSAMTSYPDATEYTTISLEHAGDPRRVGSIGAVDLSRSLERILSIAGGLLRFNDNKSESLSKLQRGALPAELSFFLIALAVHGYEPVSLRYFRLEPDGSIHYYSDREIDDVDHLTAEGLRSAWLDPDFSPAFSHSELVFAPIGSPPGANRRVHRHLAVDLSDPALSKDPSLLAHLAQKGRVAAMTKAASYLLWRRTFSKIRDYLLENMETMVSDSTGIPPKFALEKGFALETYGTFAGSFLGAAEEHNRDFKKLWASQPRRELPFRYGYVDSARGNHLLITRRVGAAPAKVAAAPIPKPPPAAPEPPAPKAPPAAPEPPAPKPPAPKPPPPADTTEPGQHWRLETEHGVVHAWRPTDYRPAGAGTVVYLHGAPTTPDRSWSDHRLAAQFAGSRQDALFIVPDTSDARWTSLRQLLVAVRRGAKITLPDGPIIAVAHGEGVRTLRRWLRDPRLQQIILLDALDDQAADFTAWLTTDPGHRAHRLTLVSASTVERTEAFVQPFQHVRRRRSIPEDFAVITPTERRAQLMVFDSQYEHGEIVASRKVLPVLLRMTPLAELAVALATPPVEGRRQ